MHGTWKVTGAAGGGGALAAAAAVAAVAGAASVLAHIFWILATVVLCAALTAVAVARLMRWSDRRAIRVWSQRPAQLRAEVVTELPRAERPAIENHYHFHITRQAARKPPRSPKRK